MDKIFILTLLVIVSACSVSRGPNLPRTFGTSKSDAGEAGESNKLPTLKDAGKSMGIYKFESEPDSGEPDSAADSSIFEPDSSEPDSASDSSTSFNDDSAAPNKECVPDTKQCSNLESQTCNSEGQWETRETCPYVCSEGICTGSCTPSTKKCVDKTLEICDTVGAVTKVDCPYVCTEGGCSGECVPGSHKCSGLDSQICNSNGQWVVEQTCPYICSTEGTCSGECVPDTIRCYGSSSQTCNSEGKWIGRSCPYICTGNGVCSGECLPGTRDCQGHISRTCDVTGQWVTSSECPYVCISGSCTGVCTPTSTRCSGLDSQTCDSSGQWQTNQTCPYVCSNGSCSGVCVPTSTSCQDTTLRTCNSSGQWTNTSNCQYVCLNGSCSGVCKPGDIRCSGNQIQTCNSSGQWGTATDCPAIPGANAYCSNNACTFDCKTDYDDCDGNPANGCEVNLNTDKNNCSYCGHYCCEGACSDGTCQVKTYITSDTFYKRNFSLDSENFYYAANSDHIRKHNLRTEADVEIYEDTWLSTPSIQELATNGNDVFFLIHDPNDARNGEIYEIYGFSLSSSLVDPVYGCSTCNSMNITFDNTNVYWISGGRIDYYPLDRSAGYQQIWASTSTNPGTGVVQNVGGFVSDNSYIYFVQSGNSQPIWKVPISNNGNGQAQVFETTSSPPVFHYTALQVYGPNLYYVFYQGNMPALVGVWKKPLAGGNSIQIVSNNYVLSTLATDGTSIYYTAAEASPGNNKYLMKDSINGGASVQLLTMSGYVSKLRVIGQCLYWYDDDTYRIKALAVSP